MFGNIIDRLTFKLGNFIMSRAYNGTVDKEFVENELQKWEYSPKRLMQIKGFMYYENEHDILHRKRTIIGEDGKLQTVDNLPNNKIIDNQYAKLVNQKTNYLFGKPLTFNSDNEAYIEYLKKVFDKNFMRIIKNAGKASYNGGISWLYPYYTEEGVFAFRIFPAYEILPFWKDSEHSRLDFAVRLYTVISYCGSVERIVKKVEIYDLQGVHRFIYDGGRLIPESMGSSNIQSYVSVSGSSEEESNYNWSKIPLIPLKANESETPLLKRVKSLQDGINIMLSDFENNMQEDSRNTILVLKNYDGQNLGEFRKNLATFGAVKVRSEGESRGGVETLEVKVNAENYKMIVDIFKKALIENGMGFDSKDERMSGTPNQMNIQSMYSDIDTDANEIETEYQAAFKEILWFVNAHLANIGCGNYENEEVEIIFNRDMLMNEGEIISNCQSSVGIISNETIIENHPWVKDPTEEIKRFEAEKKKAAEEAAQYNPFVNEAETDNSESSDNPESGDLNE